MSDHEAYCDLAEDMAYDLFKQGQLIFKGRDWEEFQKVMIKLDDMIDIARHSDE